MRWNRRSWKVDDLGIIYEEPENYPSGKRHIDELQTKLFKILYYILQDCLCKIQVLGSSESSTGVIFSLRLLYRGCQDSTCGKMRFPEALLQNWPFKAEKGPNPLFLGLQNLSFSIICTVSHPRFCNSRAMKRRWHFHDRVSANKMTDEFSLAMRSTLSTPRKNNSIVAYCSYPCYLNPPSSFPRKW